MSGKGLLVVVSGPSGTGKGTLVSAVKQHNSKMKLSVSATTRSPRTGEVDGVNYFFKSEKEFQEMIENGQLVEWDQYCGNYYGTPKEFIDNSIKEGFDVVLEITVEGALNIKEKYPECVTIFVLPPSFAELRKRITCRGTEKEEVIERRLKQAMEEVKYAHMYDYVIINGDIDEAAQNMLSILTAERLKYSRNSDIFSRICDIENLL